MLSTINVILKYYFQVNQKVTKSALIKDLYVEMDRLKQGYNEICTLRNN